ncbi:hypothetical protein C162_13073 [Paenibacillus sp. FSL R7-269]|nr:hypothetical protein C162_13073 [Paenibacillus sp. FSL R7-269]
MGSTGSGPIGAGWIRRGKGIGRGKVKGRGRGRVKGINPFDGAESGLAEQMKGINPLDGDESGADE